MTPPPMPRDPRLSAVGPNAEQIEYWNETSGPRWVAVQARLDAQISPFGLLAMEAARIRGGERILDVGCGTGQSTLQLAERVGARGAVLGIDVSHVMLARARERAAQGDFAQVRFTNADAQTHRFEPRAFDLVYSRFGVMFFADPRAAFSNLREALAPGGRLAFVCWQALEKNAWMRDPLDAIARHIALPPPPAPLAPGPFAFADAKRLRTLLAAAGFEHIAIEAVDRALHIAGGGPLGDAVTFLLEVGPAAAALREAGFEKRGSVAAALREVLREHLTPSGVIMDAAAWIVSAERAA
ncbi:MAG: class I SAM-dependent methyltransferase [Myxococcales bacterium]|nr:class I SAM-dependent methyltransferase [Myxococcales bacterium]MDH5305728.1 class I SAM-dependent methyltransferase [Myxococcales bacterium]MDH5566174.1 class I SAM-dependent methyltransferase [Myxococcales bacterium]